MSASTSSNTWAWGTITERLARDSYDTDEGNSHIEVHQDVARATGAGPLLEAVCPAHVYRVEGDGTISVEFAACLECGTCLAVAPHGSLTWHHPAGGRGVEFREG